MTAGTFLSSLAHASKLNDINYPAPAYKINQDIIFNIDNITGIAGQETPVKVDIFPDTSFAKNKKTWLRVIGLPKDLRFSKGSRINDVWFMSLSDLSDLTLKSPSKFQSKFNIEFFLMQEDQSIVSILKKRKAAIEILAYKDRPSPKFKDKEPQATVFAKKQMSQEDLELMSRAQEYLNQGDIPKARLLYEKIAAKGHGQAAFELGKTYDPGFLKRFLLRGLKPNEKLAKQWYKKAIQLTNLNTHFSSNPPPTPKIFLDVLSKTLKFKVSKLTYTQKNILFENFKKQTSTTSITR